MKPNKPRYRYIMVFLLVLGSAPGNLRGDGTETLGPPSIAIASGTGVVAAGTGLNAQPGTIDINIPVGANVQQVIIYWSGEFVSTADDTIVVDGNSITGTLIGGPTLFFSNVKFSVYRADITSLGLVSPGANSLTVGGLAFDNVNLGAGVLAIIDDSSGTSDIDVRDGSDLAFVNFAPPLDTTVTQSYSFAATASDRIAELNLFFGSVGGQNRPHAIVITVDGTATTLVNPLGSHDGDFWDTLTVPVSIPAGATTVTVQALSQGDGSGNLPASFNWITSALTVREGDLPICRVTGGGNDCADSQFIADPSAGEECSMAQGRARKRAGRFDAYTFGGQCGAPGSPFGEWTHVNHSGPGGQWTFHVGTRSAPEDTSFAVEACFDAPACAPAAANGPVKQIECRGVGTFKNIIALPSDPNNLMKDAIPGQTRHAVWTHMVDGGEPGNGGPGNSNHCDPLFGDDPASCDCPDFYHITIHAGPTPDTEVIYEVFGFLRGGNFQMHDAIR